MGSIAPAAAPSGTRAARWRTHGSMETRGKCTELPTRCGGVGRGRSRPTVRDLVPHTWCMAARGPITHSSPSQITSTLIQNISEWEFPKLNLTVLLTNVTLVRNRLAYSKSGSHGTVRPKSPHFRNFARVSFLSGYGLFKAVPTKKGDLLSREWAPHYPPLSENAKKNAKVLREMKTVQISFIYILFEKVGTITQ